MDAARWRSAQCPPVFPIPPVFSDFDHRPKPGNGQRAPSNRRTGQSLTISLWGTGPRWVFSPIRSENRAGSIALRQARRSG